MMFAYCVKCSTLTSGVCRFCDRALCGQCQTDILMEKGHIGAGGEELCSDCLIGAGAVE